MHYNRRAFVRAVAATALSGSTRSALAQDAKPARILVGFPPGGSFDVTARLLADQLKNDLNRPVLVENRPGAGGRLAVDGLKSSPADGSVVMLGHDGLTAMYPFTFSKINYDPLKDLVPITAVAEFAFGLATGAEPKVADWGEFVAWLRQNPQKASYGIPALGSPMHFFGLIVGGGIGVPMQPVPYQGAAQMTLALMGGQVPSAIDAMSSLVENHKAGKIKVLAVSSEKRLPQTPDVPTFAELALPSATGMSFNALYAPAGTPAPAVAQWSSAVVKVLAQVDVQEKLLAMGFLPVGKGPQDLVQRQVDAAARWEPVIKASGFRAE